MMNPKYFFGRMQELVKEYKPSRELQIVRTKLEEAEMWLAKCEPTDEAKCRDLREEPSSNKP
ncbi:MAG TPA: hypothetical protein VGI71_23980 [Scandinavium sp.]